MLQGEQVCLHKVLQAGASVCSGELIIVDRLEKEGVTLLSISQRMTLLYKSKVGCKPAWIASPLKDILQKVQADTYSTAVSWGKNGITKNLTYAIKQFHCTWLLRCYIYQLDHALQCCFLKSYTGSKRTGWVIGMYARQGHISHYLSLFLKR